MSLTVITGCMFAGKTGELIRRVERLRFSGEKIVIIKPALDDRFTTQSVVSHDGRSLPCYAIHDVHEIPEIMRKEHSGLVAIDEAQFFGPELVDVLLALPYFHGAIVAGLSLDFEGKPFGPMPLLLTYATEIVVLKAVCTRDNGNGEICGANAYRTQRIVDNLDQVLVGSNSAYEARCIKHWSPQPVFMDRVSVEDEG